MKILVLGSGGREHALVWKLKQSPQVERVWCSPGNAGIVRDADCYPVDVGNTQNIRQLVNNLKPDLVVVGPELPLVVGAADEMRTEGFKVLGPGAAAAKLEGSKVFAKEFMMRHEIPTAETLAIAGSEEEARSKLQSIGADRFVVKADGLCAGKGVLVASGREEADKFVGDLAESSAFKSTSGAFVIEEALGGEELSYIILTDGERFVRMAPARDYKRLMNGDRGPNTGGMGSYSVNELLPDELEERILNNIVGPTLAGLRRDGLEYRGFLYFGLMLTRTGPQVLEFNCRMGDPETQSIMLRADFDLANCLASCAAGRLDPSGVRWPSGASVCVVLASRDYPGSTKVEEEIHGLADGTDGQGLESYVFHSGTKEKDGKVVASGGRVLGVAAYGRDLAAARAVAYDRVSRIRFEGMQYRADIAATVGKGSGAANG